MKEYNLTGGGFNVSFLAVSDFFSGNTCGEGDSKILLLDGGDWVGDFMLISFDCDQLGEKEIRNDGRVMTEWVIQ